jgi:hypothetical protein
MTTAEQRTLFAFDCGATNWRLYRSQYDVLGNKARLQGEPSPSPLTSFVDRRLPAVLQLSPDGTQLDCYGEMAQSQIEDETSRLRIRDYFKPCIGAHLDPDPQPHQLKFTHKQALEFTRLMLESVLAQLLKEKWRTGSFDERVMFTFAFPVHWQTEYEGAIFDDFSGMVRECLPEDLHENIRFVSEPEGAILSLQRQGHLQHLPTGHATLIVDVGGSTTDLVAGEVEPTTGELLFIGRYGEAFGGGHYDMAIARSITDELLIPASAIADDPGALLAMRNVAKRLKESLSRQLLMGSDTVRVPQRTVTLVTREGEIYRGVVRLDEARFKDLTHNLSKRFEGLLDRGMEAIGLKDDEIGQVVLVGGGAQLYSIYNYLNTRFEGKDFVLADNPDESVVSGVSLEYGAATTKTRPSLLFIPDFEMPQVEQAPSEKPGFSLVSDDESFELVSGENRVGRAPTNEIHIVSDKLSRFHAKLNVSEDSVEIVDLGSTNGTFVNDNRLEKDQQVFLEPEDEVRFGDRTFHLQTIA